MPTNIIYQLCGSGCGLPQKFHLKNAFKRKFGKQGIEVKYCVLSSFSYACIDSLAIQSDFSKCRLSVYIAIIILAITYIRFVAAFQSAS